MSQEPRSVLANDIVTLFVALSKSGTSYAQIADRLGVSVDTIKNLTSGRTQAPRSATMLRIKSNLSQINDLGIPAACRTLYHKILSEQNQSISHPLTALKPGNEIWEAIKIIDTHARRQISFDVFFLAGNGRLFLRGDLTINNSVSANQNPFTFRYSQQEGGTTTTKGTCFQFGKYLEFLGLSNSSESILQITATYHKNENAIRGIIKLPDIGNSISLRRLLGFRKGSNLFDRKNIYSYNDIKLIIGNDIDLILNQADEFHVDRI